MKISNETKVGALTAIAITILILGYSFMKGENLFTSNRIFYAKYESVEGLLPTNPVLVNGYKVGRVSLVEFDNTDLMLYVQVKIDERVRVPKNSILRIINQDLIGAKAMELVIGNSKALAHEGDTLASERDPGMAQALGKVLTPLSEKLNSILNKLDEQLKNIELKKTLDDLGEALLAFKETANRANELMAGKSEKIDGMLTNLEGFSANLKTTGPKIEKMADDLGDVTKNLTKADLKSAVEKATQTLNAFSTTLEGLNKGEGTLGKMIKSDDLYLQLSNDLNQVKKLLEDIEKFPRRYTGFTERQRKKGDKAKKDKDNP